jgi:hypothetical protein
MGGSELIVDSVVSSGRKCQHKISRSAHDAYNHCVFLLAAIMRDIQRSNMNDLHPANSEERASAIGRPKLSTALARTGRRDRGVASILKPQISQ